MRSSLSVVCCGCLLVDAVRCLMWVVCSWLVGVRCVLSGVRGPLSVVRRALRVVCRLFVV